MKRFREVVQSIHAPEDKDVLWLDISKSTEPVLKYYSVDSWIALAGGSGPGPTPTQLNHTYYYGASDTIISLESAISRVLDLTATKSSSVSGNFNKVYFYIAIYSTQNISSVITANNENITSQFNNKGSFSIGDDTYKLYEFFLDTLIPLDVNATIRITE